MNRNNTAEKNKYILMPDSFKGTMDAVTVCGIMRDAILSCDSSAQVISVPIADGGEGTVDCFVHAFGGERIEADVKGPYGKESASFYGRTGDTAVVELAAAAGFTAGKKGGNNPAKATTYGVGQLIKKAVEAGSSRIILGLGGSCSNDGGAGMAAALGTEFYDENGESFVPTGDTLHLIARIDNSRTEEFLRGVTVDVMCDIDNPLYGAEGAAYVFAPQKGADERMVRELDMNLRAFAETIQRELGTDVSDLPGAGAAGGAGAGAYAFLGASLRQGIDVILDMLDFDTLVDGCRMIFTGEGQLDSQSLGGKVVVGIARRAAKHHIPVTAVVGRVKGDAAGLASAGISGIVQTDPGTYSSFSEVVKNCRRDLYRAMEKVMSEAE